jgi:hypothetical protein
VVFKAIFHYKNLPHVISQILLEVLYCKLSMLGLLYLSLPFWSNLESWQIVYSRTVELVVYIQSFLVLLYITSCFVFVSVLRFFSLILAHVFVLSNKKKKCSCFCNVTWFDSLNYGFILVVAYYFIHFFCWHIVVTQNVLR